MAVFMYSECLVSICPPSPNTFWRKILPKSYLQRFHIGEAANMTFYKVLSSLQLYLLYSLWKRQKLYSQKTASKNHGSRIGMFILGVLCFE